MQSIPARSLSLPLLASVASIALSNVVINTSASNAPMLAKISGLTLERTIRTDLTNVSRNELMFTKRLRELEAVTAANGGVGGGGIGVGVESGVKASNSTWLRAMAGSCLT